MPGQLYIGVMSGTSLDAVDTVLVDLDTHPPTLLASHNHPIDANLRAAIIDHGHYGTAAPAIRFAELDHDFGQLFADAIIDLLSTSGHRAGEITAIGSHGQTLLHEPDRSPPLSIQLGDGNVIAARTGITTVCDFRRADLLAGGQGAPLAPAFHAAMLSDDNRSRVVINLGGIANITVLDCNAPDVTGFDTGPANALLDAWHHRHRQQAHDKNGAWADSGSVDQALLSQLKSDAYFLRQPPKSTGREYFNLDWLDRQLEQFQHQADHQPTAADVQATLLELTVTTVVDAIHTCAANATEALVCGGGVHNGALMQRLRDTLFPVTVASTHTLGIDPDWLEAIAFAWLARQRLQGRPGNLPGVTGADRAVVLGAVYTVANPDAN